ncbi:MAG TPA: hypothetical protein VGI92_05865 [Gemmatimonadales bacterium]|jgi:hypothetical protein
MFVTMPQRLETLTWAAVPPVFRSLARWITIAQAAGYGVSIVFARQTAARFLAAGGAGTDSHDLLLAAHSHLLGMTALFALSGVSFALCDKPGEPFKRLVLVAPFAAILIAFVSVWMLRMSPVFTWPLLAANLVMAVAFYTQIIFTLRALRRAEAGAEPRSL